jgi:hypothetical protein
VSLFGKKESSLMVTIKQAWIGLAVLFLVVMLIVIFTVYWQHVTGVNALPLLGPLVPMGC